MRGSPAICHSHARLHAQNATISFVNDDDELTKLANRSGFLFQLGVEELVRRGLIFHQWEVIAREYPWSTADGGRSGFIDVVAGRNNLRCVIECKRTQGGEWIFPVAANALDTLELRTLWAVVGENARGWGWDDLNFNPSSLRAEFCIVRGASDEDKPMLERIAGDLVRASESLAREELLIHGKYDGVFGYLPVIVTNASLIICRVDPAQIDTTTGLLPSSATFETVNAVRFRKALATDLTHAPETYTDLGAGLRRKERSVFVVHVSHLPVWLAGVREAQRGVASAQYPWEKLLARSVGA